MKRKHFVLFLFLILMSIVTFALAACNKDDKPSGTHKISFYIDDTLVETIETNGNESIAIPTAEEKAGYYFVGWFDGTNEITADSYKDKTVNADIIVRAKYNKYIHVKYEMNGGAYVGTGVPGELPDGDLPDEYLKAGEELQHGDTIIEKNKYIFAGWYDNAELSGEAIKMPYVPTSDVTLYANWAEKYVTLENGMELTYNYSYDGTFPDGYGIYSYSGTGGNIVIPADYKGLPIIEIGSSVFAYKKVTSVVTNNNLLRIKNSAFQGNTDLKTLIIADTVNEIGQQAFLACSNLESVTIGTGLEKLGEGVFGGCNWYYNFPSGEAVYIGKILYTYKGTVSGEFTIKDGTVSIADNAFDGQKNMTSITIPQSVKYIGQYAFRDCSSLKEVTLPENLLELGSSAFKGSGLTSVVIPNSMTYLGNAFNNCTNLKSITIGNGVKTIDYAAFQGCGIEEIVIPENVTDYGAAFSGNTTLKKLTILCKTPCSWYSLPDSLTEIYVPSDALDDFKSALPDYSDKIFAIA